MMRKEASPVRNYQDMNQNVDPSVGGGGTEALPSIGGGRRPFGLGGVSNRTGMFDFDDQYLKNAQADLRKLNAINEPGIAGDEEEKKEEHDGRSML